jgi:hypothetical protein
MFATQSVELPRPTYTALWECLKQQGRPGAIPSVLAASLRIEDRGRAGRTGAASGAAGASSTCGTFSASAAIEFVLLAWLAKRRLAEK